MKYGTRLEVFTGVAEQTRGGLRKENFVMGANGRVASKKLSDYNKARWAAGGKAAYGKDAVPDTPAATVVVCPEQPSSDS